MAKDYSSLKILRITDLIKLQNMKWGHKIRHSQLPPMTVDACVKNAQQENLTEMHQYSTQNKRDLNHPLPKSKWYQDSFMVQCYYRLQCIASRYKGDK